MKGKRRLKVLLQEIVCSLKEHGMFYQCIALVSLALFSLVCFFLRSNLEYLLVSVILILMAFTCVIWSISNSVLDDLVKENRCLNDGLVIKEHEIERLTLELETYKEEEASRTSAEAKKQNPIKSNRIVSDKTFAIRLRSFAQGVSPCDAAGEEEKEYIQHVAERLVS